MARYRHKAPELTKFDQLQLQLLGACRGVSPIEGSPELVIVWAIGYTC